MLTFTDAVTVDVSLKYCWGPLAVPHHEPPVNGLPSSLNCNIRTNVNDLQSKVIVADLCSNCGQIGLKVQVKVPAWSHRGSRAARSILNWCRSALNHYQLNLRQIALWWIHRRLSGMIGSIFRLLLEKLLKIV